MVDLAELHLQYITDETGEKTSVIVPLAQFQELVEDIEDLATAAERREESTISHEESVTVLKRDGLL